MHTWSKLTLMAKDAGLVGRRLQQCLPQGLEIEHCKLSRIRRLASPAGHGGSGLVASYLVFFHDRVRQKRGVQLYSGRVLPNAARLYQSFRKTTLSHAEFGEPLVYLSDLSMVLFAFPNDPELPHLAQCTTKEAVEACLHNVADFGGTELLDFSCTPLKYDPGRGCTCRFVVVTATHDARSTWQLIAKTHVGKRGARTFETMSRVWADPVCRSGSWAVAKPLYYDPGRRLLWQEALPGQSFWRLYPNLDVEEVFSQMARAAATLHQSGFAPRERLLKPAQDSRGVLLAETYADLAHRLARVVNRLQETRGLLGQTNLVALHGDFHPDQFLIHDGRVALTDFDSACWGEPAYDLGRFASHVFLKAVEQDIDPDLFRRPLANFFEEYARSANPLGGMARVFWQIAAQLAGRRVHKLLKQLTDRPRGKIEQLLALAEEFAACAAS